MRARFTDQAVIISGASSGIGRALALAFAKEGARVGLAARREGLLQEVAQEIKEIGARPLVLPTDVTQRDQVREMVQTCLETWGVVDLVVANAGKYIRSPVKDLTENHIQQSLAVNFYGSMYLVLETLPHFVAREKGHIALMATLDAKKGIPPDTPYVVAKSALASLGGMLRQELRETGIEVTIIYPGRVDTPMIDDLKVPWISKKISPERVAQAVIRGIARNRAEVIVPWHGRLLGYINAFFPRLADSLVRLLRLEGRSFGS